MRRFSEKQINSLLGIGIGLAAGAVIRLSMKLADSKMDLILKKLSMKEDLTDSEENDESEAASLPDEMFEE